MSDPLTLFTFQGWPAPYTDLGHRVVPVRCKSGLAMARTGSIAHQVAGAAAVFQGGRARYGARWLCGQGSTDAVLLATADSHGGVCRRCQNVAAGPAVYRCFGADGTLLYIGSTNNRGVRITAHASHAPWWPQVSDVQSQSFASISEARVAERRAIQAERPAYNRRFAA